MVGSLLGTGSLGDGPWGRSKWLRAGAPPLVVCSGPWKMETFSAANALVVLEY
jgi:hypothetical protein